MYRLAIYAASMLILSGCMTVTGIPREDNVIYQEGDSDTGLLALSSSVSVGDVSNFPGMSIITLAFKTNPNLDDDEFEHYLQKSLENAGLFGNGYVLNAELVDGDNFGLGVFAKPAMGTNVHRNIHVKYTLTDASGRAIFSEVIEGDGTITNWNFFWPYHLIERKAAEKGYADNIKQLINHLSSLQL